MSSNKKIKEELIRRYGNKCFIERLHLRDTKDTRYTGCNQYKRMKMLTYHHIIERHLGGRATIENGALLSAENHEWFHRQPKQAQRKMNQMFQDLKQEIDYQRCRVEFVDELECPFEPVFVEMSIDPKGKLDIKAVREKQKRKEKTELQKLRKEWEDR